MNKSILNYTTQKTVKQTVAEIINLLSDAHATAILTELDQGIPIAINFRIATEFGALSFRVPADIDGVFVALSRSQISQTKKTREHARRVGWRIVKDWLEAQLAMVRAGLVRLEQVFLPYAQDSGGRTVYDLMRESRFGSLALTDKSKEQTHQL
jgi:hypothetical protein